MSDTIISWCDTIYPDRHPNIVLAKLAEELEELKDRPCDGHELADVMILLLDYCHLVGVDIATAVRLKMEINKERTWEIDDEGKLQHKRPTKGESSETLAYCGYCEDPIAGGTPVGCRYDRGEPCLIDGPRRRCGSDNCPICPDPRY